jgi:hypothetical protein
VLTTALEADEPVQPAQDKVRRLPSVEQVSPAQPAAPQEELPPDQIPFYPSTRTRPAG